MFTRHCVTRRDFLGSLALGGALAALPPSAPAAAKEPLAYLQDRGWLLGCWTRPWAEHDYRVGFDAITEAGFRYVGLTGAKSRTGRVIAPQSTTDEAQVVGQEARQRGLTIATVYGGNLPLEKGPEILHKMIDNCAAAGGWSVLLSQIGTPATYDTACRTVAAAGDYARQKQVVLVLKPHGGTTGTGPQLRDAVQRCGPENLTVMYDPGNILYYSDGQLDPLADCQAVSGLITGLSVKDYRHPKEVMLTPGAGQIDFAALLPRLRQGGFTHGPLLIEGLTPGDLQQTLAEAQKAKQFVEALLRA